MSIKIMAVAFDRAIIKALCELMGDAAGVFMMRTRDALVKEGVPEEEANKLINSFLATHPDSCFDISSVTGTEVSPNGVSKVRSAIMSVIEDLMGDDETRGRFIARMSREIKASFPGDVTEAISVLNEVIEGSPIISYEANEDQLVINLKEPSDILACTIAHIRTEDPVLVEKAEGKYVFKKHERFLTRLTFQILTSMMQ